MFGWINDQISLSPDNRRIDGFIWIFFTNAPFLNGDDQHRRVYGYIYIYSRQYSISIHNVAHFNNHASQRNNGRPNRIASVRWRHRKPEERCSPLFMSHLISTGCKNLPKTFLSQIYRRVWTRSIPQTAAPRFCSILPRCGSALRPGPMELKDVLNVLEDLAPLSLAEPWDNVGLLLEPSEPRPVKTVLLTNDLTRAVMEEARAEDCDLIISYHPPLFRPFKRLVQKDWKQRLAIRALEAGIAVFSPHTSWDSVRGGVNDWLVGGLGAGQVSVLNQAYVHFPYSHVVQFQCNDNLLDVLLEELKALDGVIVQDPLRCDASETQVSLYCSDAALAPVVDKVTRYIIGADRSVRILKAERPPWRGHGQGRLSVLDQPVSVATAVKKMKSHLGLSYLRLALGQGHTQGASVLNGVQADLYVTGEMSHHEVLDAVAKGTSVILSDHSNSERGYLSVFRDKLTEKVPADVVVMVSKADRDPLEVV
ncbi:NIF3-like protein 1 isoform X2 [Phyllopteryx taeniolatus]|uniref:NIF3-like protein 1 isoform X2 n=1 Tax=Phyllopteryx taeniolatus TaxID=161469 RepID=UPI002AD2BB85|nr:NIF3-like protein 1 isoform X2 [Phyllopteryx taeniolatus]